MPELSSGTPPSRFPTRSMRDMLDSLSQRDALDQYAGDGWRHLLPTGMGFRHCYDADVADGGWEFHALIPGLCLAITDMSPCCAIRRGHSLHDQLVLSAMLDGSIPIFGPSGVDGSFEPGFCTLYGMSEGAELKTFYQPGVPLRWISLFIDRHRFHALTRLSPDDLPATLRTFIDHGGNLPQQSIPLTRASRQVMTQIMGCPRNARFRHPYLTAKALELACSLLSVATRCMALETPDQPLTPQERMKLERAMRLLRQDFERPPSVTRLASQVGLSRQKLQYGFREVYGDTVAQVRDRLRMEHALALVRDSRAPMTDIALETGYEYLASFTRAFRNAFGMSPTEMRRASR
jgi:AraC-like DNA-binding protein